MAWKLALVVHWFLLATYVSFSTVLAKSKHKHYTVSDGNVRDLKESRSQKSACAHLRNVLNAKKGRKHSFLDKALKKSPNNYLLQPYGRGQRQLDSQQRALCPCSHINSPNNDLLCRNGPEQVQLNSQQRALASFKKINSHYGDLPQQYGLQHMHLNTQREVSTIKFENNHLPRPYRPAQVRLRPKKRVQQEISPNKYLLQLYGPEQVQVNSGQEASPINSPSNDLPNPYGPEQLQQQLQQQQSTITINSNNYDNQQRVQLGALPGDFPNNGLQQPYGPEQVQFNFGQSTSGPLPQIDSLNNELPHSFGTDQVQMNSIQGASPMNFPNIPWLQPYGPEQMPFNSEQGASPINFPNAHLSQLYGPEQVQINSGQGESGPFPQIDSPNYGVPHPYGPGQKQVNSQQTESLTNFMNTNLLQHQGTEQVQINSWQGASPINSPCKDLPYPGQRQLHSGQGASGPLPQINFPNNDLIHPYGPDQVWVNSGEGASGPFPQRNFRNNDVTHPYGPGEGQLKFQPAASDQFLPVMNSWLSGLSQGYGRIGLAHEQVQVNSGRGGSGPFPQINFPNYEAPHLYGPGQGQLNFQSSTSDRFLQLLNPLLNGLPQGYSPEQVQVNSGWGAAGPFPQIGYLGNDLHHPYGLKQAQLMFPLSASELPQLLNSAYIRSSQQGFAQQGQLNTPQGSKPYLLCQILFNPLSSCHLGDTCCSSGVTISPNRRLDSVSRSAPKAVDSATAAAQESATAAAQESAEEATQEEVVDVDNVAHNVSSTVQTLQSGAPGTKPSPNIPEEKNPETANAPTKVTVAPSGGANKPGSESSTPVLVSNGPSMSDKGPLPFVLGDRSLDE